VGASAEEWSVHIAAYVLVGLAAYVVVAVAVGSVFGRALKRAEREEWRRRVAMSGVRRPVIRDLGATAQPARHSA
jgi:hypothetical protein